MPLKTRGLGRDQFLKFRVNQRELDAIDEAAKLEAVSVSTWCRIQLRRDAASTVLTYTGKKADL